MRGLFKLSPVIFLISGIIIPEYYPPTSLVTGVSLVLVIIGVAGYFAVLSME